MRIARSLTLLSIGVLAACKSPTMPMIMSDTDAPAFDRSPSQHAGQVFTMSNASAGNAVLAFSRAADGSLRALGSFTTGGNGTNAGLGNQGGLALDEEGRTLVVVNAGSNDITAFRVDEDGSLERSDRI